MERDPEYYKILEENTALQARVAELEDENSLLKMQHEADAAAIGQMARKALTR